MPKDCLQQLFQKLHTSVPSRDYVLLLQHSFSFDLRQQAIDDKDHDVYRRAGLCTPDKNAARDLEGGSAWLDHITMLLCREFGTVLWLRTLPTRFRPADVSNLSIIDAASDPFGWNVESGVTLEDLNFLVKAVQSKVESIRAELDNDNVQVPLVIQSLTPLVQRHGLIPMLRLLDELKSVCCPVIVPVLAEAHNDEDHRRLEDASQAILWLFEGEACLLRQGARERGNLIRETIPYDIVTNDRGARTIEIVSEATVHSTPSDVVNGEWASKSMSDTVGDSMTAPVDVGQRLKVHLKLEEQDGPRHDSADNKKPHIYIDDDDPEFDDFDEEDPDDDLDI